MAIAFERRSFEIFELRAAEDGGKMPTIAGHAAVFNKKSDKIGGPSWGFREKIQPGAFKQTIKDDDVRALWNHNPDHVLGRNKAKTLRMSEDDKGLAIEIDPPDTTFAQDLVKSIERGDVSHMSFGFDTLDDDWGTEDGEDTRTLRKVKLYDVSPVTFPTYPQTDVGTRSLETIWKEGRGRMELHKAPSGLTIARLRLDLEAIL